MTDMVAVWERIIDELVAPQRRERLRYWLASPRRRDRLVDEIGPALFDPRCLRPLTPPVTAATALDRLGAMTRGRIDGDSPCIELAWRGAWDGRQRSLADALHQWVGTEDDVLLYCPEDGVGYHESHVPGVPRSVVAPR